VGAAGGALALAAAMLLVVRRPAPIDDLSAYEMALSGGAREYRGEATPEAKGPLRMRKGDRFEAILRPPRTTAGTVGARALLVRKGAGAGDPAGSILFRGTPDVAPGGTVRVSGTLDDFPGVTPARGICSSSSADRRRSAAASRHGWQVRDGRSSARR
jgi:hypothetical protein